MKISSPQGRTFLSFNHSKLVKLYLNSTLSEDKQNFNASDKYLIKVGRESGSRERLNNTLGTSDSTTEFTLKWSTVGQTTNLTINLAAGSTAL